MKPVMQAFGYRQQLLLLLCLAFALNVNTLFNDYALDDAMSVTQNRFVSRGISGIPDILKSDLMAGFTGTRALATEVRYRPLPLVLLALETQFFGLNPLPAHAVNLLLLLVLTALLFNLLYRYLFPLRKYLAFLTVLLFSIHPVHTEVIANIKSGDELLAVIFLLLSLVYAIRYTEEHHWGKLIISLSCYLLALLCRETAVTFIALVPLVLYYFRNIAFKTALLKAIPYAAVFALFLLLRFAVVGMHSYEVKDVQLAPFLLATPSEAFATKIFILIKYLGTLVFPFRLSSDYGYNHIPYIQVISVPFILSLLLLLSLLVLAWRGFRRKTIISFCILSFFVTISIGSNLILDLGSPMADRMLFQPSLAFCLACAAGFIGWMPYSRLLSGAVLGFVLVAFGVKTVLRNADWKNTETLYLADAQTAPNSARISLGVSEIWRARGESEKEESRKKDDLDKAQYWGEHALQIDSACAVNYISLGFVYYDLYRYEQASVLWLKGYTLDTSSALARRCLVVLSGMFYEHGSSLMKEGRAEEARQAFNRSAELDPAHIPRKRI